MTRIAFVGCGYVADFYVKTLRNHPELELAAVMDRDADRAARFARFHRVPRVATLAELLADPRVEIVVNLTNPDSHYDVSRAALEAGKHVYSEKPLAMRLEQAEELVALARARGLRVASAPCSVLGESAQTLWRALRRGAVGQPRLVYAELDDGPVHLMGCERWKSESGAPWPCKDEFEVGCTMEHAGYYLTWLAAFFGPARTVSSFATCLVPDKGIAVDRVTADFTVACIEYASGVVARLTCSIYAPHDHALRIVGDGGVLSIEECWNYGSPVYLSRRSKLGIKAEKHRRLARLTGPLGVGPRRVRLARAPRFDFKVRGANAMDFVRGVAELADAVRDGRPARLSPELSLHVNELALAIQSPGDGAPRRVRTTFEPIAPMPWAT